MDAAFFQERYPSNYPPAIPYDSYKSILEVFEQSVSKYADLPAFQCLGQELSYKELDEKSSVFAAYLQNETNLVAGDRIALQLPNVLQYPIAMFGALRAGMVVVNTNPLYTEREMEHQFNDSGAKALVVLANMASKAEKVVPKTSVEHVIVTEVGDMHSVVKRTLINAVLKYVKKEVEPYNIKGSVPFRVALSKGSGQSYTTPSTQPDDIAVLQYTGGTTGVAKGAMLTHANIIANMSQCSPVLLMSLGSDSGQKVITPLPLYHIYAFTVHCMVMLGAGNCNVLIPNPRDIEGFVKVLQKTEFSGLVGLNTLFVALCNHKGFTDGVDFSKLKVTISGGMALTQFAADEWEKVTGCTITEGYGMTEASPVVTFNVPGAERIGYIGLPLHHTVCKVIDENGNDLGVNEEGELCVKGPQVMKGYWQREEATAKTIDENGWLKTGDVAVIEDDGLIKIVDRKKDMIIVSGFNVYPNEVENVIASHPDVVEVAAVGVPDDVSGEVVKVFVVTSKTMSEEDIVTFARTGLTGYKIPKLVEFRDELPKTNVGKVLRRELRDGNQA